MIYLAKTSGVLLEDHICHLMYESDEYFKARSFVVSKYSVFTGHDLIKRVHSSIRWHDEGKKHKLWQTACQLDHEELKQHADRVEAWCKRCERTHVLWRAKTRVSGRHLLEAGGKLRHEMASLEMLHCKHPQASLVIKAAVAAHHSKLSEKKKHKKRWSDKPEFEKFWNEFFDEKIGFYMNDGSFEHAVQRRYEYAGPRALLQHCDHRASAAEEGDQLPELDDFTYTFPEEWTKRGVQKEIEKLWDEPFAILRAPTGAGKTDAAFLWAKHQIHDVKPKRADRLVIAMPTRFTANALSVSSAEKLGAAGLYHSSAWYQRIKDQKKLSPSEQSLINKEQVLARKLETPVTVTTIDHLCICLTGTREDHHATFFNLAHSCVVIDEADFYDDFTQQNIVTLLRALRVLKVPVLLMSATVPESVKDVYGESGFTISEIHEDRSDYERVRCIVKKNGGVEKPDDIADLLQRALNGEPTIIYANTVRRAQDYYRWFIRQFKECSEPQRCKDVVLYHSRFTEPHKADKEAKLVEMLGSDAWEHKDGKKPHGIAILTQIGEISVNISADLMISDMCPFDRLAQRVGRLARFKDRGDGKTNVKGELFVIKPQTIKRETGEPVLYPAPYGTYDNSKREWIPGEALDKSIERIFDGEYSAKTFVDLVNQIYPSARKVEPHVMLNQRALENCVMLNWLIAPAEQVESASEVEPDDDHTKEWKSRDIPPQITVYTIQDAIESGEFNQYFQNRSKFREFQLRHGLQCYVYEFNRAVEAQIVEPMTFQIGEEAQEQVFVVRPEFYNSEIGLHLDKELSCEDDEGIMNFSSPGII